MSTGRYRAATTLYTDSPERAHARPGTPGRAASFSSPLVLLFAANSAFYLRNPEAGDLPAGDFGLPVDAVQARAADHLAANFNVVEAREHSTPDCAVDARGVVGGEVGRPLRERIAWNSGGGTPLPSHRNSGGSDSSLRRPRRRSAVRVTACDVDLTVELETASLAVFDKRVFVRHRSFPCFLLARVGLAILSARACSLAATSSVAIFHTRSCASV